MFQKRNSVYKMIESQSDGLADEMRKQVEPCYMGCGLRDAGLELKFEPDGEGGVVSGFECAEVFAGYSNMLHGGVIATILDSAMGNCMFQKGMATVTIDMSIRFSSPVFTNSPASVSAKVVRKSHPLYLLEAEIVQDGEVKAKAKGKFYDQPDLASKLGF